MAQGKAQNLNDATDYGVLAAGTGYTLYLYYNKPLHIGWVKVVGSSTTIPAGIYDANLPADAYAAMTCEAPTRFQNILTVYETYVRLNISYAHSWDTGMVVFPLK